MVGPLGWWAGGNFLLWTLPHKWVRFRRQDWSWMASQKRQIVLTAFKVVFLKLYYARKSPGDLMKNLNSYLAGLGWGPKFLPF